jgi:predicted O-methyltransferase YrrM
MDYPNWFLQGGAQANFQKHLNPHRGKPLKCLQIGAYTGDATVWLFENILSNTESHLTDVDTWEGSNESEHKKMDWQSVEEVYDAKTKSYSDKESLLKVKTTSDEFFESNSELYDFIYIDGDHTASSVLKDGINAVKFLSPKGVIAFDDYLWRSGKGETYDPYPSINAIMTAFKDDFDLIEIGLQVWLKKK